MQATLVQHVTLVFAMVFKAMLQMFAMVVGLVLHQIIVPVSTDIFPVCAIKPFALDFLKPILQFVVDMAIALHLISVHVAQDIQVINAS
jgi:hypothetical protein